jgi:SagB-type dehydrogenase family enzyme
LDLLVVRRRVGDNLTIGIRKLEMGMNVIRLGRWRHEPIRQSLKRGIETLSVAEVATLLRWVWGAHGTLRLAGADVGLRRTSPSGGSLHPIEVYPVVRRVEGLSSGLYHYLGGEHALEQIAALDEGAARALVEDGTAGQWYFGDADVAFIMTARFRRSSRKYRRHPKIYRATLVDAGHLSQTFYLLCTELARAVGHRGAQRRRARAVARRRAAR